MCLRRGMSPRRTRRHRGQWRALYTRGRDVTWESRRGMGIHILCQLHWTRMASKMVNHLHHPSGVCKWIGGRARIHEESAKNKFSLIEPSKTCKLVKKIGKEETKMKGKEEMQQYYLQRRHATIYIHLKKPKWKAKKTCNQYIYIFL